MATTNVQLYVLVAEELQLISGNEALSADDSDKISRRASRTRSWLIEEGLCYWLDDDIPDAAALPLAQIVAGQCAEMYGRGLGSSAPYPNAAAGYALLERHVSQRSAREPVKTEYF